eukprot:SAG25_NODE_2218_length_1828_cov_1.657027_1_plen_200_part_00
MATSPVHSLIIGLSGRFHSQFLGKNRRDIGKSQSKWTDSKMETPGSRHVCVGEHVPPAAMAPRSPPRKRAAATTPAIRTQQVGINSRDEDSYAMHGVVPSSHRITSRRMRTHESRAERVIRSPASVCAMSLCWTLTATCTHGSPPPPPGLSRAPAHSGRSTAECTCAIEAEARHLVSKDSNTSSSAQPSSRSTVARISS